MNKPPTKYGKTEKANFVVNNCFSQLHKQKAPQKCVATTDRPTTEKGNLLIDAESGEKTLGFTFILASDIGS